MKFFSSLLSTVLIPLIIVLPIRAQLPPAPSGAETTLQVRVLESSASKFTVEVTDGAAAPAAGAAVAFRLPDSDPIGTFADGSHAAVVYTDSTGRAHVEGIHWNQASGTATVRITAAKGAAHAGLILEQGISTSVVPVPVAKAVPQPGVPKAAEPAAVKPAPIAVAHSGASDSPAAAPPPSVSVTNASPGEAPHSSSKKWLVIALLAGAAGAGAAFAMKGKGGSTAAPAPSLSIGNPSISIGHP